jgi:hypothetical protein
MSLQAAASLSRPRGVAQLHRYEAELRRIGAGVAAISHIGDIRAVIEQFEELAGHASQFEDLPRAAALLAVAETLRGRTSFPALLHATERLASVHQRINNSGDPAVRDAAVAGRSMSLPAAVALALRVGRG